MNHDAQRIYKLRAGILQQENEMHRLRTQRDALLKTMEWLDHWMGDKPMTECSKKVRAAIKAVEEGK